jgi:hypothetical protein
MNERISDEINEVKDDFEEYANAKLDMVKLHAAENLSRFFSGMIVKMVMFYLFFFVLLFISLAIAFWLDRLLDSNGYGFFIVAGFYLIAGLLFYALRRVFVERPIIQSFVQLFFPNYSKYDESK